MKLIEERWDWENDLTARKASSAERIAWVYGALGALATLVALYLISWPLDDNYEFTVFVWGTLAAVGGTFTTMCLAAAIYLQATRHRTARQRAQMRSKLLLRGAIGFLCVGVTSFVKFFCAWPQNAEWTSLGWRPVALLAAVAVAIALAVRAHRAHLKWRSLEQEVASGALVLSTNELAAHKSQSAEVPRVSATAPTGLTILLRETHQHSTYRTHAVPAIEVARIPHPKFLVPLALENIRRLSWARYLMLAGAVLCATTYVCLLGVR